MADLLISPIDFIFANLTSAIIELISPIFDFIFANLTSAIIEEFKRLWNIEDEVNSLSITLSTISAVLEDAEEQQITSRAVKDWLRKLKDVAYDADDVLDVFATRAAQAKDQQVPPESSSRSSKKDPILGELKMRGHKTSVEELMMVV